jgi:hypothetical protein
LAVLIVLEDLSTFNPSGHYMLQEAGDVKSWLARHYRRSISFSLRDFDGRYRLHVAGGRGRQVLVGEAL